MSIEIQDGFYVSTALPIDSRQQVPDLTARDAIPALVRWEGMEVYVLSEQKAYKLVGGITDDFWMEGASGGGLSAWETATDYEIGDIVIESDRIYRALATHTSDVFADDLTAGSWAELSNGKYIAGPESSTDNAVVRFDGETGKIAQNSNVTISDAGEVSATNFYAPSPLTTSSFSGIQITNSQIMASSGSNLDLTAFSGAINLKKNVTFWARKHHLPVDDNATGSGVTLDSHTSSFVRLKGVGLSSIFAIPPGSNGDTRTIVNLTGGDVVIHNDASVTASTKILTGTGQNLRLKNNGAITVTYDFTSQRWYVSGGAGGGTEFSDAATSTVVDVSKIQTPYRQITQTSTDTGLLETGNLNLIKNPGFEGMTLVEYTVYRDTPGAAPVDGIGGGPNSTLIATTSSPLRGAKSGLFNKDAGDWRGEGFSTDFTIDGADKTKILDISFDYETSPNYADGDMRIYVYDITNSRMIELVNRDLMANANGTYRGFFQASPDSVNYRLIGHIATTNALAYTVKIDNVKVAPQAPKVTGAVVTDWKDYTPTGSWTTNTTYTGKWRRVGDSIEISGRAIVSGVPSPAVSLYISIPDGLVINSSKLSPAQRVGSVYVEDAGIKGHEGFVYLASPYSIGVSMQATNETYSYTTAVQPNAPFVFNTNDYVSFEATVPIQGWSSNMVLSEDAGNRLIVSRGTFASVSIPNQSSEGSEFLIPFAGTTLDTTSSITTSVGRFTAPESGYYRLNLALVESNDGTTGTVILKSFKNGSVYNNRLVRAGAPTPSSSLVASDVMYLLKGEYVDFRAFQNKGSTLQFNSGHWSFEKISSPQTIAASETVAVRVTNASGQVIPHNVDTVLTGWTTEKDTHNSFNPTLGVYTFPVSGWYAISPRIALNGANTALGFRAFLYGEVNNSGVANIVFSTLPSVGTAGYSLFGLGGTTEKYFNKGDTIKFRINQNTTSDKTLLSSAENNYLSITRVGN